MSRSSKAGITVAILFGLLFSLTVKKNNYTDTYDLNVPESMQGGISLPPIVFYTSIADTLPAETLQRMEIGNIIGQKITTGDGTFSSYFEYHADPQKVLDALAQLPFHRSEILADTTCRTLEQNEVALKRNYVPGYELAEMSYFWNLADNQHQVFECYKPPYLHTVIVQASSRQVRHRIALIAG